MAKRSRKPTKSKQKLTTQKPKVFSTGGDELTSAEVAKLLDVHPRSLIRMRSKGNGPAYTKRNGRIYYSRAAVKAYLSPGEEAKKFQERVPEHLPLPEPVRDGKLSKHNAGICEAMARAGRDLEGILLYLGVERRAFETDVLEQLTRHIAGWMEETRFLVNRATIASALTSKQMSDRQQAAKIFETTDLLQDKWARMTASAADNILVLIKRAKRIEKLKREGKY